MSSTGISKGEGGKVFFLIKEEGKKERSKDLANEYQRFHYRERILLNLLLRFQWKIALFNRLLILNNLQVIRIQSDII
jgi:hypothetical protein